MSAAQRYRGRFAPSPSGPLHFGSLIAALASYLDARAAGGAWLVRIEDIDPPREQAGASDAILRSLEAHGLTWDEPVLYQSTRGSAYDAALKKLDADGHLFPCVCTRATLGPGGNCGRRCAPKPAEPCALRVNLPDSPMFQDVYLGRQVVKEGPGDLVLKRKDGLFAYNLAVVVDDADQGITRIVRGRDLLEQTPAQNCLHQLLGQIPPEVGHIPLAVGADGGKLSKQNKAAPLDDDRAPDNLQLALRFLGQRAVDAAAVNVDAILESAIDQWNPRRFVQVKQKMLVYQDSPAS
ncbi:MAG: tRNA glutamyl-Q(34) synthetase GluQRS [Pseudomonadota bacterium]